MRLFAFGVLLWGGFCSSAAADDVRPPNIVLIVADDQGWDDFGFMGNPDVRTPHLDRLASRSARYVDGYLPTSVCRPSLATLLDWSLSTSARDSLQPSATRLREDGEGRVDDG